MWSENEVQGVIQISQYLVMHQQPPKYSQEMEFELRAKLLAVRNITREDIFSPPTISKTFSVQHFPNEFFVSKLGTFIKQR